MLILRDRFFALAGFCINGLMVSRRRKGMVFNPRNTNIPLLPLNRRGRSNPREPPIPGVLDLRRETDPVIRQMNDGPYGSKLKSKAGSVTSKEVDEKDEGSNRNN